MSNSPSHNAGFGFPAGLIPAPQASLVDAPSKIAKRLRDGRLRPFAEPINSAFSAAGENYSVRRASCARAAATIASTVMPNFLKRSPAGALAPNVDMPMKASSGPSAMSQP